MTTDLAGAGHKETMEIAYYVCQWELHDVPSINVLVASPVGYGLLPRIPPLRPVSTHPNGVSPKRFSHGIPSERVSLSCTSCHLEML